jgi:hypothetical protein
VHCGKNRYLTTKTFKTNGSEIKNEDMTGMKINIKKRNGMMSNIANTAVLRRRGRAGDEDSIAGTKTGVEVESIYRKDNGTSLFHETELCHENIHRKYKYSDTQEINNNNNNNNDNSGNDNISGDINENEEEESAEVEV